MRELCRAGYRLDSSLIREFPRIVKAPFESCPTCFPLFFRKKYQLWFPNATNITGYVETLCMYNSHLNVIRLHVITFFSYESYSFYGNYLFTTNLFWGVSLNLSFKCVLRKKKKSGFILRTLTMQIFTGFNFFKITVLIIYCTNGDNLRTLYPLNLQGVRHQ